MNKKLTGSIIARELIIMNERSLREIGDSCYIITGKFNPEDLLLSLDRFKERYLHMISKMLIKNIYSHLPISAVTYSRHRPETSVNEVSESLEQLDGLMLCVRVKICADELTVKFSCWHKGLYNIQVYRNGMEVDNAS